MFAISEPTCEKKMIEKKWVHSHWAKFHYITIRVEHAKFHEDIFDHCSFLTAASPLDQPI